ncbi:hypothetical protein F4779DRAFT_628288 [Xylariaceae sp. FL0662B]|nr:hypothetical protein F4779DRAFT_628288 [Xylariaceae sp. FL0662B]
MEYLGGKQEYAAPVPAIPPMHFADKIIPLHSYDDTMTNRAVMLECTMRFGDVLDPNKLRLSLEKLLSRPDWRKLGARLRLNARGRLEYHIPEVFDEKRPAISFSHTQYNVEIDKHAVGARLPRPTALPAALLNAWIAVLDGRDADVPPLHGVTRDPLATLGLQPHEPYALEDRRLGPWEMILFVLLYFWNTVIMHRGTETRMACIPARHVKTLHQGALADLASQSNGDEKKKPFVSEGDVISGWMTRLALRHLRGTNQTVSIMNALGMRTALAKDLLPATSAYVGNAVGGVYALIPMRELFSRPLGYVASVIRRSIVEQGTREQVEARAAVDREAHRRRTRAIFGDARMTPVMFSNWNKAKFFETDFSAAVVRPGTVDAATRANKPGRPSYIQPNGLVSHLSTQNSFLIVGKDAEGNYWVSGTLRRGLWAQVQEAMDSEPEFRSIVD